MDYCSNPPANMCVCDQENSIELQKNSIELQKLDSKMSIELQKLDSKMDTAIDSVQNYWVAGAFGLFWTFIAAAVAIVKYFYAIEISPKALRQHNN